MLLRLLTLFKQSGLTSFGGSQVDKFPAFLTIFNDVSHYVNSVKFISLKQKWCPIQVHAPPIVKMCEARKRRSECLYKNFFAAKTNKRLQIFNLFCQENRLNIFKPRTTNNYDLSEKNFALKSALYAPLEVLSQILFASIHV